MEFWLAIVELFVLVTLVGVTCWYAHSTRKILREMRRQAEATERQAYATLQSVELIHRSALPEWQLVPSYSPRKINVTALNRGLGPAQRIQVLLKPSGDPNEPQPALEADPPLEAQYVKQGEQTGFSITYEGTGRWAGVMEFGAEGRWGSKTIVLYQVTIDRRPDGLLAFTEFEQIGNAVPSHAIE